MNLHFISGLPRSGSTLLSALLRQNPKFYASMTSPMYSFCTTLLNKMSGGSQYSMFFDDNRRHLILTGLFKSYYMSALERALVFDTNRTWTGRASLLASLYPDARIICCVRDVGWIIDSIEQILRKNPLQMSRLFNYDPGHSVYARTEILMNSDTGFIGQPWSCLREAWFGDNAHRLVIIEYKALAASPEDTMRRLYAAIGEPFFQHNFDYVEYDEPDYDALLGMPGMHKIAEKVEYKERPSCIPPDLFEKYAGLSFWKKPEFKRKGIVLIL